MFRTLQRVIRESARTSRTDVWILCGFANALTMVGIEWIVHLLTATPLSLRSALYSYVEFALVSVPLFFLLGRSRRRWEAGTPTRPYTITAFLLGGNLAVLIHVLARDGALVESFEPLLLGSTLLATLSGFLFGLAGLDRIIDKMRTR